jgi:hypothetical protein
MGFESALQTWIPNGELSARSCGGQVGRVHSMSPALHTPGSPHPINPITILLLLPIDRNGITWLIMVEAQGLP